MKKQGRREGRMALWSAAAPVFEAMEGRRMLSASPHHGMWYISGHRDGDHGQVIELNAIGGGKIQAMIDGKVVGSRNAAKLHLIRIRGTKFNDIIRVHLSELGAGVIVRARGREGNDLMTGDSGTLRFSGGAGDDTLEGGSGNDQLNGDDGQDEVHGNDGNDMLIGSGGGDSLFGGGGDDQLHGRLGDDELDGGGGHNSLFGGAGVDTLSGSDAMDSMVAVAGDDVVQQRVAHLQMPMLKRPPVVWDEPPIAEVHSSGHLKQVTDEEALKQRLIDAAVEQWKNYFGQSAGGGCYYYCEWEGNDPIGDVWVVNDGPVLNIGGAVLRGQFDNVVFANAAVQGTTASLNSSQTNTQEQGVDEADLVENDGHSIYTITNQDLVITDALPAGAMHVVSRSTIDGQPVGMYLHGDRLTVISSGGDGNTLVTVFDVTDRSSPVVMEKTSLDGQLLTSRQIEGRLYVVLQNAFKAPMPEIVDDPTQTPNCDSVDGSDSTCTVAPSSSAKVYESEEAYRARLEAEGIDALLPGYTTSVEGQDDQSGSLAMAGDLYLPETGPVGNLTSVALFDVDDDSAGPKTVTTLGVNADAAYASQESMYLVSRQWESGSSDLFKLSLGADEVPLVASGQVDGTILNEFAMDEQDGKFRVATTGYVDGQEVNSIWIYDQAGDQLTQVGGVSDIAPGERIYGVRFLENRAYLVTFRQVDPLFTVDLSDPTSPKVIGELQIPGFSRYLQPISDRYVVGIGQGEGGGFHQLQISLFDVSDFANPQRVGLLSFGDGSYYSDPFWSFDWDHHAVSYFEDSGVLAVPMKMPGQDLPGLEVMRVGGDKGLEELGFVEQDGGVRRSLAIGDTLYSVGPSTIQAEPVNDPELTIDSVSIGDEPVTESWGGLGTLGKTLFLDVR